MASFLVLIFVLSTTAFNTPLVGNRYRVVGHNDVDTITSDSTIPDAVADTSVPTKLQAKQDSLPTLDSLSTSQPSSTADSLLLNLDSLKAQFDREHGIEPEKKSGAIQWNDSVAAAEDSIRRTQKKSALESPVVYTAKDSMTFFMNTKNAFLYGDANVKYQKIELTSENIRMNMDSSTVYAIFALDSLGKKYGTPVFKDGGDEYKSETMSYNFNTKKGYITNIYTAQEDGFLTSEESKKGNEGEYYLKGGTYTTCDEEHPHFYIRMSRAKVRPGKNVFSGPAWLVVEDVPLPIAVPFAFFPITGTYSSGFIMPTYGDEFTRGFYLRDGGYYFAISDYMDLKVTGEIFTKGSWGIGTQTTYKKRYKYHGNFYFNYQVTKDGEKNMPDYSVAKNFKVQWSHSTDPKASPNTTFSASVNFATQSYEKNNLTSLYNPTSYSQSTRTSSISYSHNFRKIGLSLSTSANISQNMRDSILTLALPNLTLSLSRFYPFKRKHLMGKERWYEKISVGYTGTLSNSITTKEDKLMHSSLIKDWRNGMRHTVPVSASFSVLNYITITPQLNYTERWYTHKVMQDWDTDKQKVKRDTIYGFNRVYDFNFSISANTRIYGMYKPNPKVWGKKLQMVRHVFTPSISFNYTPDFGESFWGYWKTYTRTDEEGNVTVVPYSPYAGSLYGHPGQGMTGSIGMDISNNIEAKIKDKNDSIKKISIIDELGASLSYNMAAKRQPWSNLTTRIRLKWGKTTFNMNTVWQTYAYEFDKNGNVVVGNRTEWSYGRWGRFQGMSKNISYTFNNQSFRKMKEGIMRLFGHGKTEEEEAEEDEETEEGEDPYALETNMDKSGQPKAKANDTEGLDKDGYMKFQMPWSFSISYGLSMYEDRSKDINVKTMRYPYSFTQNLNFSGNLKLSSNWNCNFASGWDFNTKKISMTTVNISRDMHCFNISCGLVFGIYTSYHISLRANASTLTDALKYDKKSSYSSAIQWY